MVFAIYASFPFALSPLVEIVLAANLLVLIHARRLAKRDRLDVAVTWTCVGLWVIALTLGVGLPIFFPILPLLAIWPVFAGLPYVTQPTLKRLMIASTCVAIVVSLLSLRGD